MEKDWKRVKQKLHSYALKSVESMAGVLFEDIFDVKNIDPEGKKFDRGEYPTYIDIITFV